MLDIKLLHITATHLNSTGGVPVVLRELVHAQNQLEGFTARVLSLAASTNQMNSKYFDTLENCKLDEYLDNYTPNIVILHSFYYVEYNHVIKNLIRRNIPYLIEPHGSFGKNAMRKSFLKKWIANHTIFRKQIKRAKAFIFLNEEECKNSVYRKTNDIVIPNGFDASKIVWNKKTQMQKTLYFIGRYDINHKGLDYLFNALKIIDGKGIRLNVAFWGKGDEHSKTYIDGWARELKNVNVKENGPIYGKQQSEQLEQLGPMLLTSRYEGFPMTILEAWAYGNPCIVTPGTNMSKEISEEKLGWATTLNPDCIANAIITAVREYEGNSDEYIERCKRYVSDNYSWNKIANISYKRLTSFI